VSIRTYGLAVCFLNLTQWSRKWNSYLFEYVMENSNANVSIYRNNS